MVARLLDGIGMTETTATKELIDAVWNGRTEEALALIEAGGINPNGCDENGYPVLVLAAIRQDMNDVIRQLLDLQAEVDKPAEDNMTALFAAINSDNIDAVKDLIAHGASVDGVGKDGCTPLTYAVGAGASQSLAYLLSAEGGADPDVPDWREKTIFRLLEEDTNFDLDSGVRTQIEDLTEARRLAAEEADQRAVDEAEAARQAAFHEVAVRNQARLYRLAPRPWDFSAAARRKREALAPPQSLTQEEMDDRMRDALRSWNVVAAERLLDKGFDIDAPFSGGETPLTLAAGLGDVDMVKMLLRRDANVNALNIDGQSALIRAATSNRIDVMKVLIEAGADLHVTEPIDIEQHTALSRATYFNHPEAALLLIDAGMDTTINGDCAAIYYAHTDEMIEIISDAPERQRMLIEIETRGAEMLEGMQESLVHKKVDIVERQDALRSRTRRIRFNL